MGITFDQVQSKPFELNGGVDLVSSHLKMLPGSLLTANNFELVAGKSGPGRIGGYERCTNDILPSKTTVSFFKLNTATGPIVTGDVFTAVDKSIYALESIASPQDGDVLPVATHDADFDPDATYVGTSSSFNGIAITDTSGYTATEIQSYRRQAIELTRSKIPVVPGEGITNGWRLRGKNYVVREGHLYRGDEFAWTEITMPHVMFFNSGTVALTVGETVTDGTATAVIASMTRMYGSWNAALAVEEQSLGYLTLTDVVGDFTVGLALTDTAGGTAAVSVSNAQYTLPAGGRYETRDYNFTNLVDNESIYGVSGVGEAFEFDGTNYIPIFHLDADQNLIEDDKPTHVNVHQERLHLAYPGGQLLYSVSGQPRVTNALLGSGTYSTGSEITAIKTIHGNAEAVFCKNSTWLLTGDGIYDDTSATRNWMFFEHDDSVGAEEWSINGRGYPMFMSAAEVRSIQSTDTTGAYDSVQLAGEVQPFLDSKVGTVVASLWARKKAQYRLFFTDGSGISLTFNSGSYAGAIPFRFPAGITSAWSEVENEIEYIFFVSTTGYLYRMDSGNSFDEEYIEGSFRLPFYHYGTPRNTKLFPEMLIELDAPVLLTGNTEITYTVNHSFGSPNVPRPLAETVEEIDGGGGMYGNNDGFGNFIWGGALVSQIHAYLDGEGQNMSILVTYKTKYDSSFRFLTAIVDYITLGPKTQG
jgi:hypothetical protein